MKKESVHLPKPHLAGSRLVVAALAFITIVVVGCAGSRHSGSRSKALDESLTLPPFLTGPLAALLTNANDFSARMVIELPSFSSKTKTIRGSLLGQGSNLLFAPAVGDRSLIWDVAQNRGYVLSEALQGWAPIAPSVHITNVVENAGPAGPVLVAVNGRPCHRSEVVISSSDGTLARFVVWRTADANRFPVEIKSVNGTTQFTIDISDMRREVLAQKLFLPPDDFTKYASAESMRDELVMRQKSAGKKVADEGVSGIGHSEIPSQMGR